MTSAIVKTISKHGHTKAGIDYILDGDKTMNLEFSSSINCAIETAHKEFDALQNLWWQNNHSGNRKGYVGGQKKNVTGIHIIQSFHGQEVSPGTAHKIAHELVRANFGAHAQAVIATHTDRENIHNHIVINSVDMKGTRFYNDYAQIMSLRKHSDSLCRKYGLSVIEPHKEQQRGLHYKEYMERSRGASWKGDIRNDIDSAIISCSSWDELLRQLREQGYKVNDDPNRKYATLQKDDFRPVRFATLGYHYGKDRIIERIFRLILRGSNRKRKTKLSAPYSLLNDYYLAKAMHRLTVIEKQSIRTKEEMRRVMAMEQQQTNRPRTAAWQQREKKKESQDVPQSKRGRKPKAR